MLLLRALYFGQAVRPTTRILPKTFRGVSVQYKFSSNKSTVNENIQSEQTAAKPDKKNKKKNEKEQGDTARKVLYIH